MKIFALIALLLIPISVKAQCEKGDSVTVTVSGLVNRPGPYKVDQFDTFPEIILKAGGLKGNSGLNEVSVKSEDGITLSTRRETYKRIESNAPNCMFDGDVVTIREHGRPFFGIAGFFTHLFMIG